MVWMKILGGLSLVGGLLMIFAFPDLLEYQSEGLSRSGIVVGIFLALLGVFLIRVG